MSAPTPSTLRSDDFIGDWQKDMADIFRILNKNATDVSVSLNGQVLLTQLGAKKIQLPSVSLPSPWKPMALVAPWVFFGGTQSTPAYRIGADGRVYIKGLIKSGAINANINANALPAWSEQLIFSSVSFNGTSDVAADIRLNPTGFFAQAGGSNNWLTLDNISWMPLKPAPYVPSCFPIAVQSTFKASMVLPGEIVDLNQAGGAVPTMGPVAVSWHNQAGFSGSANYNNIVIDNISGLIENRTYSITLWALPAQ